MLCDRCKKETATTYYKQTVNGKTTEYHLCDKCAAEMDITTNNSFTNLFGSMFGLSPHESIHDTRCPGCGMSYSEIAHTGKPGCAQCYETFRFRMRDSLEKIHGNTKHVGRVPGKVSVQNNNAHIIEGLKNEMAKAIEKQEFEEAARLRDKIKELEGSENVQ